jgi:hypothetical protein
MELRPFWLVLALLGGCGGKTAPAPSAPDADTSGSDSGETNPEPEASTTPVDAEATRDAPPSTVYCSRTLGIEISPVVVDRPTA